MAYKDGEEFTTYCDKLYDRHSYKIVWKDGSATNFEDYETVRGYWYHYKSVAERVEIIDDTSGKGF